MLNPKLLDILVCPVCKGKLIYSKEKQILVCRADGLAYPIKNDIPIMLEEEALQLKLEEIEELR